jgi:hypothetical protein
MLKKIFLFSKHTTLHTLGVVNFYNAGVVICVCRTQITLNFITQSSLKLHITDKILGKVSSRSGHRITYVHTYTVYLVRILVCPTKT